MSHNLLPCEFEGKINFIHLILREHDLGNDDWYLIRDGDNDAEVVTTAPFAVGYRSDTKLAETVDRPIGPDDEFINLLEIVGSLDN